jgi:metal-responsive CopG/Arc/MetJ family transcriptional regulator
MRMVRLNITLPDDLVKQLKQEKNKSRFIAEALREKINREKRKETERLMKEGYSESSREDQKLNSDWEKTSLEEWE